MIAKYFFKKLNMNRAVKEKQYSVFASNAAFNIFTISFSNKSKFSFCL